MGQLDTRILSLYSRNSRQEKFSRLGDGQYYSFCYYDAIEVVKVECESEGACHNLLSAYETAANDERRLYASRQFLLAFADIQEQDQVPSKGCCYKQQNIEDFWKEDGKSIFFVTMVNLRDNRRLDETLSEIRRIFSGEQYLAYLTFDHCDLLLFYRGDGFSTYAGKIFQLNYGTDLLEDSITLYSFNDRGAIADTEQFGVYLRFGIQDYTEAKHFVEEYKKQGADVGRLLGRNDMGLFKKDANMSWLKDLISRTLESPKRWYITYELSVLIQIPVDEPSWTAISENPQKSDETGRDLLDSGIEGVMATALREFLEAYRDSPAGMPEDPVWTHWLSKTSSLAASLYDNPLAMDFGTCLVPQFLDLFSYMGRLLRSELLSPADRENVREIFSAFFSSTSILMDSINHSSRQFVQVPSFGSVSFEMPPKLMAYYTAMTHKLIEVFRDDNFTYGIAFCPEFVSTLKVTSHADQGISKDEWITVSIDERSLYTLQLTTETLGHEISHFVGEQNRCRDVREIRAIQTGLAGLAAQMLCRIREGLAEYCGKEVPFDTTAEWSEIYNLVNKMMKGLRNTYLPKWSDGEDYSRFLQNRLANLPNIILSVPDLTNTLEEWLCELLLDEKETVMSCLTKRFAQKIGGPKATPQESSQPIYRAMARECIHAQLIQELEHLADDNGAVESGAKTPMYDNAAQGSSPDWICYMFSEAFADLQMILLFNLDWEDYQTLFMQDETHLSAEDCPPRLLAVAKALVGVGKWRAESIQTTKYAETDRSFGYIGDAVALNISPTNTEDLMNADSRRLQSMGFETDIIFYLSEYLKECYKKIKAAFQETEKETLVKELRMVHDLLSKRPSVYELEMGLIHFIDNYRSDLKNFL